jgi:hypothetical protein
MSILKTWFQLSEKMLQRGRFRVVGILKPFCFVLFLMLASAAGHAQSIDGGTTWTGWNYRGTANTLGIYGSGSTTYDYGLYTTNFVFSNQAKSGGAIGGGPTGGTTGFGTGGYSAGAFKAGNFILGIGVTSPTATNENGIVTIKFDLSSDSYQPATSVGGTDGKTSWSDFSQKKDYTIQFWTQSDWRGQTVNVQSNNGTFYGGTGNAGTQTIPGGSTGYDYPFRAFRSAAGGSWQLFVDVTAMQAIYGPSFTGWEGIGNMGSSVRFVVSPTNMGDNSAVLNAPVGIPEPSSLGLLGLGVAGLVFRRRLRVS